MSDDAPRQRAKLVIRTVQLHLLARQRVDALEGSMVEQLRRLYPQRTEAMTDDDLLAYLRRVAARCRSHGLNTQGALTAMSELMFQVGEDFENFRRPAWARQILEHPALPAEAKVQLLARAIHDWTGGYVVVRQ